MLVAALVFEGRHQQGRSRRGSFVLHSEILLDSLRQGRARSIPGFSPFERVHGAARTGRNPSTGETSYIPAGFGVKVSVRLAPRRLPPSRSAPSSSVLRQQRHQASARWRCCVCAG
ncbi:HU family DNA-binding protein [Aeromicrobium sp. UC242_57]|uniref:HU family DNA-binding protein n=1 Tax=Aeromicrobium sp. UC242_57 TaxID=3374624 RepID=UPI0037B2F106